jgi:hypothetical protein
MLPAGIIAEQRRQRLREPRAQLEDVPQLDRAGQLQDAAVAPRRGISLNRIADLADNNTPPIAQRLTALVHPRESAHVVVYPVRARHPRPRLRGIRIDDHHRARGVVDHVRAHVPDGEPAPHLRIIRHLQPIDPESAPARLAQRRHVHLVIAPNDRDHPSSRRITLLRFRAIHQRLEQARRFNR